MRPLRVGLWLPSGAAFAEAAGCAPTGSDPVVPGGGELSTGWIDEFALWRRALTESEVQALCERDRPLR